MKSPVDLWTREDFFRTADKNPLCGVDEAGRGPLAGPVCAAAVVLPRDFDISGLNDSKKMSAKRRDELFERICAGAVSYGIAFSSVEEIESMNILNAALLAMNRAIALLQPAPAFALIDGNITRGIAVPAAALVGGDGSCASIAAASVLAKVTRDRYMLRLAEQYPQYGFDKHKGYGTKQHYDALREFGPSPVHRMSFLKKFYGEC